MEQLKQLTTGQMLTHLLIKVDQLLETYNKLIEKKERCGWTLSGKHHFIDYDMWRESFIFGIIRKHKKIFTYKRCIGCGKLNM